MSAKKDYLSMHRFIFPEMLEHMEGDPEPAIDEIINNIKLLTKKDNKMEQLKRMVVQAKRLLLKQQSVKSLTRHMKILAELNKRFPDNKRQYK